MVKPNSTMLKNRKPMPLNHSIILFLFVLVTNSSYESVDASCTDETDCSTGHWCARHSDGSRFCKEYASLGDSCEYLPRRMEDLERCDPAIHYCFEPESCEIADLGGVCELKSTKYNEGACCTSNDDCSSNRCEEDCSSNRCDSFCIEADRVEDDTDVMIKESSNDEECTDHSDCGDGKWCAGGPGNKRCKDYAPLDSECNGHPISLEDLDICDLDMHQCYQPDKCFIPDLAGQCKMKSMLFPDGDCCRRDSDCESNSCNDICLSSEGLRKPDDRQAGIATRIFGFLLTILSVLTCGLLG